MKKKITQYSERGSPLYRWVYASRFSAYIVLALFVSFTLQSVDRVFANEIVDTENLAPVLPVVTDNTLEHNHVSSADDGVSTNATGEAINTNESGEDTDTNTPPSTTDVLAQETSPIVVDEVNQPVTDTEPITTEEVLSDESATGTSGAVFDVESLSENQDTNSDETVDSELADNVVDTTGTSTTSENLEGDLSASSSNTVIAENDRALTFLTDECVAVEDGSYYCQKSDKTQVKEDAILSLPDVDGDLEIYIQKDGQLSQITFNTVDDASPYYDQISNSIVWHRLVDERYQIVVYDINTRTETQITDTTTNNMEPHRFGIDIVWQHWADNAWQIMLYNNGKTLELTSGSTHNLAPVIRNGLVMWHHMNGEEKVIEVYDIATGVYTTISDSNGGAISNPRMVLVYDAAMDNGDVVTRGYDLITGEITSFASIPAPFPTDIPEPDTTGETRALIQPKPTNRDDATENLDDVASSTNNLGINAGATPTIVTGTTTMTIDMQAPAILEVVGDLATSTSIATTSVAIPDVLVPAFDDFVINADVADF